MSSTKKKEAAEAESYYSKDFDWDQLRQEIENDPSLRYHLLSLPTGSNVVDTDDSSPPSQLDRGEEKDSEAWNDFHTRHSTGKFFKERRYLLKEFPELASCGNHSKVLEVGCGNGSTVIPILRRNDNIIVYACDCSNEALERAKENVDAAKLLSTKLRFHPFLCDFSTTRFPEWLACTSCRVCFSPREYVSFPDQSNGSTRDFVDQSSKEECKCCIGGVDFVTLIFTLSALPLYRMRTAIAECFSVLKPGGLLLFRDYGLYDMTMLRFEPDQRVGYREYMRSDKTRSYFFCLDSTRDLFSSVGFTELELEYCCVKSENRRNGKIMRRVWVHGKFQKP